MLEEETSPRTLASETLASALLLFPVPDERKYLLSCSLSCMCTFSETVREMVTPAFYELTLDQGEKTKPQRGPHICASLES